MRECSYCGALKSESDMEARVKVSVGEDLFFCSRKHALEVYHRLGDQLIGEFKNGQ